ncbi:MAG: class I SAM-dependent methyltransferase [Desulfitobacteriaceae bacterium]|nr:class I SAM-dependent methyltransferase [Desulfitobacteriaceae bacterium]MDD4346287.1 class I SAM-dependent methyltransferase [Desulfitobacteriaceae bacterium]MDD4400735.1 class I SAM-dependent methyltransferase [Desulfitobacteriaceae bacterium]
MPDSIKLGPRLNCLANLVGFKTRLADIGTDHAYLPIALCEQGKIERAIAIELHQGPYQTALAAVQHRRLTNQIELRPGNGLQPLRPGEVDTLTLAGMGGKTILEILFARPDILAEISDLLVQPQGLEAKVRSDLLDAGWLLREEHLVEEGRVYVIMAFSRKAGYSKQEILELEELWIQRIRSASEMINKDTEILDSLFWRLGPLLLQFPNPLLQRLIQEHRAELTFREQQMQKSRSCSVQQRRQEVLRELDFLEVITRLD